MQEQHRLAMGTHLGLAVAQHAGAFSLEAVARRDNVVDFVADVVDAAVRVALQEFRDRRGSKSSIFVFGKVMNTVVTPCSACWTAADATAPRVSR